MNYSSNQLRKKFIDFFEKEGHSVVPSSSLVPVETKIADKTLFVVAGMQSLLPYLLGEKHPAGSRIVNIQKCIRTADIDEVGDDTHNTFFEMMGFWSLGDYGKKEAIEYTFKFLTIELGINKKNLAVTCFGGEPENSIPKDDESAEIWRSFGIPDERIAFLGRKDNFWGPVGPEGPCGPDTEIFAWTGKGDAPEKFDPSDKKWVEIGNDVFMEYDKKSDGKYEPLQQKNVDFGAGFERILTVINGAENVYHTDLFELSHIKLHKMLKIEDPVKERIILDHTKAAIFIINDGVVPSNKDQGYVVRRLIRRAVVKASQLGIEKNFLSELAVEIFKTYEGIYFDQNSNSHPELDSGSSELDSGSRVTVRNEKEKTILEALDKEETKFRKTLSTGLRLIASLENIGGKELFDLYQSHGLPLEVSIEEAKRLGVEISNGAIEQFNNLLCEHQELSRTASAGMFKGGLADAGEITTKYHTATHLLLSALRQVLGEGVFQKGANIDAERIRFDFSHPQKLSDEEIKNIEEIINQKIQENLSVTMEEMTVDEAKSQGAMGVFDSKYGDKVKVYTIGDINRPDASTPGVEAGCFSREICGGPHVAHTGELGHFKITKEESSSAGVRRIKAVLE